MDHVVTHRCECKGRKMVREAEWSLFGARRRLADSSPQTPSAIKPLFLRG